MPFYVTKLSQPFAAREVEGITIAFHNLTESLRDWRGLRHQTSPRSIRDQSESRESHLWSGRSAQSQGIDTEQEFTEKRLPLPLIPSVVWEKRAESSDRH
ncbi:hypothetical protein RRG08_031363 [Elysia crispata]|uniref:Uncharacterized protein n=1 Tax=Elysia crispata TaxID=231223 RepID=A0AAE1CZB8_9GAST|nr:hypothetical protein RRG08_031363 [Elysia crispata]